MPTPERIERAERVIRFKSAKYTVEHPLLICATQPDGRARCVVNVIDCRPFEPRDAKAAASEYRDGLWAWVLSEGEPVDRVPIRGSLGFFHVDDALIRRIAGASRAPPRAGRRRGRGPRRGARHTWPPGCLWPDES